MVSAQSRRVLESFGLPYDPARGEEYRRLGWWRPGTILDAVDAASEAHPDHVAVVGYRAGDDRPVRLTYAQLQDRVARAASFLLAQGIGVGDVVSVQLPNWWQFPVIALATLRVGAVLNPVLPFLREREISLVAGVAAPKVYFAPRQFRGTDYAPMLAGAFAGLPAAPLQVFLDQHDDIFATPAAPDAGLGSHRGRGIDPDLVSDMQFTSGTTGEPKGVGHIHATLLARVGTIFEALDLSPGDVAYMPSPVTHSTGFVYGVLAPLSCGMTTVLQDVWEPRTGLRVIAAEGVTWTFATTAFIVDLIRAQRQEPADVSALRYVVSGGAAIPPAVVTEADEVLGARVMAVWGMTENGAVTCTRHDQPRDAAAHSDGPPCSWMRLRVVDQAGDDVPLGQEGELMVRGASQMLGYVRRPELTRAAFDAEGWFRTGDLARLAPDGTVRITGRVKDLIIRGGENIPVTEIETILYSHPQVADVAIVPYPDERLGERACAVVVPHAGTAPALADLTAYLAEQKVAKAYWPERVELVQAMPRTASGKIQKFELRALVASAARAAAPPAAIS